MNVLCDVVNKDYRSKDTDSIIGDEPRWGRSDLWKFEQLQ